MYVYMGYILGLEVWCRMNEFCVVRRKVKEEKVWLMGGGRWGGGGGKKKRRGWIYVVISDNARSWPQTLLFDNKGSYSAGMLSIVLRIPSHELVFKH